MNIYFTDTERVRIRVMATRLGVSDSYVVRLIVRETLGLSTGLRGAQELDALRADMSKIGQTEAPVGQS